MDWRQNDDFPRLLHEMIPLPEQVYIPLHERDLEWKDSIENLLNGSKPLRESSASLNELFDEAFGALSEENRKAFYAAFIIHSLAEQFNDQTVFDPEQHIRSFVLLFTEFPEVRQDLIRLAQFGQTQVNDVALRYAERELEMLRRFPNDDFIISVFQKIYQLLATAYTPPYSEMVDTKTHEATLLNRIQKLMDQVVKSEYSYPALIRTLNSPLFEAETAVSVAAGREDPKKLIEYIKAGLFGFSLSKEIDSDGKDMIIDQYSPLYDDYPVWKKILEIKLESPASSPRFETQIEHRGEAIGTQRCEALNEEQKIYSIGNTYLAPAYHGGFGKALDTLTRSKVPDDAIFVGSVMPESQALEGYTERGRLITGITHDTAVDPHTGALLKSEPLIQTVTPLAGTNLSTSSLTQAEVLALPEDQETKIVTSRESIKETIHLHCQNGRVCTRLCWKGQNAHLVFEDLSDQAGLSPSNLDLIQTLTSSPTPS